MITQCSLPLEDLQPGSDKSDGSTTGGGMESWFTKEPVEIIHERARYIIQMIYQHWHWLQKIHKHGQVGQNDLLFGHMLTD